LDCISAARLAVEVSCVVERSVLASRYRGLDRKCALGLNLSKAKDKQAAKLAQFA